LYQFFFIFYIGNIKSRFSLKCFRTHVGRGMCTKHYCLEFFDNFKYVKMEFEKREQMLLGADTSQTYL
jgi:hypothetical protein